jgi:hypothetical protein
MLIPHSSLKKHQQTQSTHEVQPSFRSRSFSAVLNMPTYSDVYLLFTYFPFVCVGGVQLSGRFRPGRSKRDILVMLAEAPSSSFSDDFGDFCSQILE